MCDGAGDGKECERIGTISGGGGVVAAPDYGAQVRACAAESRIDTRGAYADVACGAVADADGNRGEVVTVEQLFQRLCAHPTADACGGVSHPQYPRKPGLGE